MSFRANIVFLIGILFAFLLVPFVQSATFELNGTYAQRETVLTSIQGTFLEPLTKESLSLWRTNIQVPFEYDLKKIGSSYYIWFITPAAQYNYTLKLTNVYTLVNGQPERTTLSTSFHVTNQSRQYSFKPAFLISNGSFKLQFSSYINEDQEIPLGAPYSRSIRISPGENLQTMSINSLNNGVNLVSVGYGRLLIDIEREGSMQEEIRLSSARVFPSSFTIDFYGRNAKEYLFPIRITNLANEDLRSIVVKANTSIFREISTPSRIRKNSTVEFNVTVAPINYSVQERIQITLGNETTEIPVSIRFHSNETLTNTTLNGTRGSQTSNYFCRELNGNLCQGNEVCQSTTSPARDGLCCLGTCAAPPTPSYGWIGYLLGTLGVILIAYIGFKYYISKKKGVPLKGTSLIKP